jgi:hypothetical protein
MRNMKARIAFGVLSGLGVLALAGSVLAAGTASAAVRSGAWSITTRSVGTYSSPALRTKGTNKVSTCVSVMHQAGASSEWGYELIITGIYNGKTAILWRSKYHRGKGLVCSPVERLSKNNVVSDRIVVVKTGAGIQASDSGTYSFDTY